MHIKLVAMLLVSSLFIKVEYNIVVRMELDMKKRALIVGSLLVVVFAGCKDVVVGGAIAEKAVVEETVTAHADWLTDFAAATKLATEKNLPILVDFSGSDWCGWCIKLDNEVFSKDEFAKYAKDNLVLFMADFPRRTKLAPELSKQNQELMQRYGVRGFPTVLVLDAAGKQIGRTGYQPGGPEKYIEHIKEILAKKK